MKFFQVICGSYVDKIQQLEAMRTSIREMFKSHIYEDIKIKINFFKLNNHAVQHFNKTSGILAPENISNPVCKWI